MKLFWTLLFYYISTSHYEAEKQMKSFGTAFQNICLLHSRGEFPLILHTTSTLTKLIIWKFYYSKIVNKKYNDIPKISVTRELSVSELMVNNIIIIIINTLIVNKTMNNYFKLFNKAQRVYTMQYKHNVLIVKY